MDKTKACRAHIKKRFRERFGIEINRHDIMELVTNIQNGDNVIRSRKMTNRVTAFDMNFKSNRCVVIYDKIRKVPVTVFTTDMDIYQDGFDW